MLEGSLDDFTLPEILRLLAVTTKSGSLRVRSDVPPGGVTSREGRVVVGQGRVCAAASSSDRLPLGRRLLGAGTVTADQLRDAVERTRDAAGDARDVALADALVDAGVLERGTAERLLHEQVQDAVFDLLAWTGGRFRFAAGPQPSDALGGGITVDDLLAQCEAHTEAARGVRERIPSPHARVSMLPDAAEKAAAGTLGEDGGLTVSGRSWRLLSLIDGRRTVGELIDLLGQGEFRTGRALLALVDEGLVEIGDPTDTTPTSLELLLTEYAQLRELEAELPPPPGGWETPDAADDQDAPVAPLAEPGPVTAEPGADRAPHAPAAQAVEGDTEAETEVGVDGTEDADARVGAGHRSARRAGTRLSTDPNIDAGLVERLIDGVREL